MQKGSDQTMDDVMTDHTPAQPPARPVEVTTAAKRDVSHDRWPERFATGLLGFAAFVLVITLVPPWHRYFSHGADIVSLVAFPVVPNLVYAALLGALAIGLHRRMRAAFWVGFIWLLVLPQIGRLLELAWSLHGVLPGIGFLVNLVVIVLAWRTRREFPARAARRSLPAAIVFFLVGGAITLVVGRTLVDRFGTVPEDLSAIADVWNSMIGDVGRIPTDGLGALRAPIWVRLVTSVLGAITVLGATYLLLRAPRFTRTLTAADDAAVRALLRECGDQDSLGYFATRRDKAVVWDTEDPAVAKAGISYRVFGSVSLASGDPLGDPLHWDRAIDAWRRLARGNGWSLAAIGVGTQGALAYQRAGLGAFELGDEAIVDMGAFSLNGPGMKPVRQAVNRLRRRGYTTEIQRHSAVDDSEFAALEEAASHWRGDGGDERGFSMALGRLGDSLDGDCVLVAARDGDGHLRGFLSFVPWGRTGLSLDLMRRDPDADNGLVELMVADLADRAGAMGVGRVSLNFAMFREAFERGAEVGAGPLARMWRQALLIASRNWQLESLYRANAKYLPEWQPRFLCYEYTGDLLRVGTAAGNAEGFLTKPSLRRLIGRAEPETLGQGTVDYAAEVTALMPPPRDHIAEALSDKGLPEQVRVRRAKVKRLRERGIDPYPVGHPRTHTLAEVRAQVGELEPDTHTGIQVSVVGRIMLKREHGGLGFATLRDGSGDLQVMIAEDAVGTESMDLWKRDLDLGDHIGVTGEVVTTRKGELSVAAASLALTSKSLRPLPDKRKGLTDPEARVRARQVDLIVRPRAREIAYLRSTVVASVRSSLHRRGFVEVETPILQLIHGGANARPFETHINAYDLDLYLRIATELHLKRLIVGGMEKVFELGKQFRNEGADFKHNPEFTSLELYETYGDYHSMRVLTQEIIQEAAIAVYGVPVARHSQPDGSTVEYDLSGEWPVKTLTEAVSEALQEEVTNDTPIEELQGYAARIGLEVEPGTSWGFLLEELYGELCEGQTTTPVFYTDFPKENAPLTRSHRHDPRLAEKWDLVIFGSEQGTAYSELIDPLDQRERLVAQSLLAAAGDAEAMQVDHDFLLALESGMPPTGGMGMGIDRLVMNLTGLGIRDTILFPLVRPQG